MSNYLHKIWIALIGISSLVYGQIAVSAQSRVGICQRHFTDSSRSNWLGNGPRPIGATIWYPSDSGGKSELITDSVQLPEPVTVFQDASLSHGQKYYPLILISHGAQSHARDMRWMAYYLALHGYIAITVDHNGTDRQERKLHAMTLSDFCMWVRPKDLSVVLDKILQDNLFAGHIDTGRIGAAGFSLGGATAIWIAGARLNLRHLGKHSPKPPEYLQSDISRFLSLSKTDPVVKEAIRHAGDDYRDRRIKAVFALAPAIGQGFTKKGLKSIHIPVQVVVGSEDIVAPKATNAAHYVQNIPTALPLIVLPGERGHYTHPPDHGHTRAQELQEVSALAYAFFRQILK
jgi:predicted dienelactone hydrolase